MSVRVQAQFLMMLAVLIWSGIGPHDRLVWLMEVTPVVVGASVMALAWRRFAWTPLALTLTTVFALILCVGAHYTYTLVPLGESMRAALGLERNPYDRLSHVFQGVITAILARELLLRCTGLRPGKALFWTVVCIALAIAAVHELVEWRAAVLAAPPEAGLLYLGGQGDVWDAQWDMAMALGGALLALVVFARLHDRQLPTLAGVTSSRGAGSGSGAGTLPGRRDMPAP